MQFRVIMMIHFGLLLLVGFSNAESNVQSDPSVSFSWWPSVHNAATLMRLKRVSQVMGNVAGPNEGVAQTEELKPLPPATEKAVPKQQVVNNTNTETKPIKTESSTVKQEVQPQPIQNAANTEAPLLLTNSTSTNATVLDIAVKLDLNKPGVVKRGLIVFGGFTLMAIAYFVFYRRKSKNADPSNSHSIDANQFRYGVLQSEDKRDTELSRIPLTMESDDEEDEDLEIFDLEQKKKSLSYVNLQSNDEDIVLSPTEDIERDNLLLDIEDVNSEALINWSGNGSKSIL